MGKRGDERHEWARNYIRSELKTDRHIGACLGSAGLTFYDDIDVFKDYLRKKGDTFLIMIIENDRSLTPSELKALKAGKLKRVV